MIPRSGGEKVYLEAVYKKPKYLASVVFAANAIILGFTAAGCVVCDFRLLPLINDRSKFVLLRCSRRSGLSKLLLSSSFTDVLSILVVAGRTADRWVVRGIAIGGMSHRYKIDLYISPSSLSVIVFVTLLHGFTPRLGVWFMNVLCTTITP